MGEPAGLTDEERAHYRVFADDVMDAARRDLDQPLPTYPDGDAMDEGTMIFKLVQEAETLRATIRVLRKQLSDRSKP